MSSVYGLNVPNDWEVVALDQIKSDEKKALISGPFGSNISAKYFTPTGVPVIRGNNLSLDVFTRFKENGFVFVSPEKADELGTWAQADDIIFTAVGTLGQIGLLSDNQDYPRYIISNKQIRLRLNQEKVTPQFVYYWLASDLMQEVIEQRNTGSSVPLINLGVVKNLLIPLPPLPEQKAIASVLSSLDDKIDLLHRQNKTLEAMAETLFRQWFIEEAKEDWEDKPLSSIATFTNGLACQKYPPQPNEPKLPVLKIKDLTSGISDSSDWATANVDPKYIVNHGDVIFAWSASLMVKIWFGETCVLNQHLFNVTSDEYPKWFFYQWCKYHLEEFISISQSHATTMGHIKRKDLDEAMVKVPSHSELQEMTRSFEPLMDKLITNLKQIQTLENLRDTLLPKLMSGEVRVQYQTEEVA